MKKRLLGGMLGFLALTATVLAGPRDAQWKQVDEAAQRSLPQTAIERLEPIIVGALAEKAYPEAIKAISRKIVFESEIQGDRPEEKIARLQTELEKVPAPMKPVMEAALAHWYWQYFQQNRWQLLQRTQIAGPAGRDLRTWDLARVLGEIDRHFSAALADAALLQTTPIGTYNDLLGDATAPDNYRPTLWDFLVYDALEFYQAGEHGAAEEEFEITATDPIFSDVVTFMAWRPETTDRESPKLKAIGLYQALLKFHQKDTDRSAFLAADFRRLDYGRNVAAGEGKDERYRAALGRFIAVNENHEISASARATLAERLYAADDNLQAHQVAQRGLATFPSSVGGARCYNLIQRIERKSADLKTELIWNAPWPTLDVTYRNVTKVYFRAVAFDFNKYITHSDSSFGQVDENLIKQLLAAKPVLEWSSDLPPTEDFKERTERLAAPTTLPTGFYIILASHDPTFTKTDNQISGAEVWVSELAVVLQVLSNRKTHSGLVLRAASGEPVAGAVVRIWEPSDTGKFKRVERTVSDANGRFEFPADYRQVILHAETDIQAVSNAEEIHLPYRTREDSNWGKDSRTVFFTDRAVYRPGQTIKYKGVSIRFDQAAGKYSALARHSLTVVFSDPNGKEIARATHQTNDYGSFTGVFTAPRDRLMGRMTLQVLGRPSMISFNVEEYKRPKFQVKLNAPVDAAKLGAPVKVTGTATAYTGATLSGAKVNWRVERVAQFPYWCWWRPRSETKAMGHGTAVTGADGTFEVEFPADPDRSVPEKNEPVFAFMIHADVIDTTGETRSDELTVRVGYTALEASLGVAEWQTADKPVEFTIGTYSLDRVPQTAKGTLTVSGLKQPARVARPPLDGENSPWERDSDSKTETDEPPPDPANPDSWESTHTVAQETFETDAMGQTKVATTLQPGIYRAALETRDRFGKNTTARGLVEVVDPRAGHYGVKLPNLFSAPKWTVEPGETFTALWGTGYETGRAFVELESNGKSLKRYWTKPGRTQEQITQAVTENLRGGFTLRVTHIHENRAYLNVRVVDVPWSNKQLTVKWEHFRSKLLPGQAETWTAIVTDLAAKPVAAEMVATLYDASLDQILEHSWPEKLADFRREYNFGRDVFLNGVSDFGAISSWKPTVFREVNWRYRAFPDFLGRPGAMSGLSTDEGVQTMSKFEVSSEADSGYLRTNSASHTRIGMEVQRPAAAALQPRRPDPSSIVMGPASGGGDDSFAMAPPPMAKPDLNKVTARKNLNEAAFFFPQVVSGENGVVKMTFSMPEALTEWKFLGFAHDRELRVGSLTGKAITAKDLMVEPNPPRFVREGDTVEFTVKVSNRTNQPQAGTVRLTFADAATLASVDDALGNRAAEQAFEIPAKDSRSYSWRIAVPDGMGFLTYKAVGASAQASDGEEGFLPVLSRRILVTESLPLSVRGKTTKEYSFKKLLDSGSSTTLRSQSLTVQMVSQPAWYAVMALPYLMEYPYECSEQVFNRFYANALARHIAASDSKIRRIFDLWKDSPALDSPLQKNEDLRALLLEETPWLRQATAESQARRNVGQLFEASRLDAEAARALQQLSDRQQADGLWTWFPGGQPNEYISLYITTGFGRLRHLGVDVDLVPAFKALTGQDAWMAGHYRQILKSKHPDDYIPNSTDALYLYGRSFFLQDRPIDEQHQASVEFFLSQAREYWPKVADRQSQAHLALALLRFGDADTPRAILKSLKERSVSNEEMGMFWRDQESSGWWYQAPIETQAMMIEAFDEVAHDAPAVEACKVWLLRQKQTQDWGNTKATADAVYGLLLHGSNLLASDALVEVSLGGEKIKPEHVEAGTGFYEQKFVRQEIEPAMGQITVKKVDDGISWGSVHWQYLEDIAKVTPHAGTPLQLKKTLFVKETTKSGQVLKPVTGPLAVGDELVVRIELRTDRDMEYVHLKDQRGSGTEPVNVLSGYRYQDGLGYYETTRDTASHFFIEYLRKGTYVFEYSTRVQLKGNYQTGIAEIQCMYAPEFNSHSGSFALEVK